MKTADLFNGEYTITEDGKLFSNRRHLWLKPATDRYGYLYYVVSINGKRFTIKPHRTIAECFISNPDNKPTVDHINGNRKDNRINNLRWATWKEQQMNEVTIHRAKEVHAMTDYYAMGAKRNFGRKKVKVIFPSGIEKNFPTLKIAAETLGINMAKASECANGKRKTTGGYKLCYV